MEKLIANVVNVSKLVEYQEGAVVSRAVMSGKAGTVTLFAFDEGQGLSEHTAPYAALVQLLEGEAEVTIAGKPLRIQAGEMVIMPAQQPHALRAIKKFKMMLVMIRDSS